MRYNNSDIDVYEKVLQVKRLTPHVWYTMGMSDDMSLWSHNSSRHCNDSHPTTVTHRAPSHESLPSLVARPEEWEKNGFQYVHEETYYLK